MYSIFAVFLKLFKTFPSKKEPFFLLIKNLLEQEHNKLLNFEIQLKISLLLLDREFCSLFISMISNNFGYCFLLRCLSQYYRDRTSLHFNVSCRKSYNTVLCHPCQSKMHEPCSACCPLQGHTYLNKPATYNSAAVLFKNM